MAFARSLDAIARSWRQHIGMQIATLAVLTATFAVVLFMVTLTQNFKRVLAVWGENVQISVYLEDGLSEAAIQNLKSEFGARREVASVEYLSKEKAADLFRDQMASYAPDLMSDSEFSTPFPASINLKLKGDSTNETNVAKLEAIAAEILKHEGVEDVSYGQSWVRNYASFVKVIQNAGLAIGVILLLGSLFIIGNSIRALLSGRRDEIEILELIGATADFIRKPYVVEGAMLSTIAIVMALTLNGAIFSWQMSIMKKSLAFARIAQEFRYFTAVEALTIAVLAAALGALGAFITVRSMNDGWSAARKSALTGVAAKGVTG
ncbi:MAG: ABC transporter permease [Deltaproteobacteria bacterium]|jgi:cell division transport system permease protein|nr:ABC transporter permease [Deltaproteobacteria bacterium]